jgi:hypothetical protein
VPTSILDIDIDDAKFKRFADTFAKYQAALGKMGGSWAVQGQEVGKQNEQLNKMAAAMLAQQEIMKGSTREGEKFSRAANTSTLSMGKLVRETHQIARNIAAATLDLVKWTGIGALLGGAGGVFSLWGISRLAGDAAGALRSARGLGVSSGEQQAFGVNYQRFVDPNSVLSNIANAKSDHAKNWIFGALGISDYQNKDPADLAVEAADKARQLYLHSDRSVQFAQAHGLTDIFSMEELRRMGATGDTEWNRTKGQYRNDVGAFAVDPAVQSKWQDFVSQLDRAKMSIENTFVKVLAPLEPSLQKFSDDIVRLVTAFMGSHDVGKWIESLGASLEKAADYLGSDEFLRKLESFGAGMAQLAEKIGTVLGWFGVTGSPGDTSGASPRDRYGGAGGGGGGRAFGDSGAPGGASTADMPTSWTYRPGYKHPLTGAPWVSNEQGDPLGDTRGIMPSIRRWGMGIGMSQIGLDEMGRPQGDVLTNLEKWQNLPAGLLDHIWAQESSRGTNPDSKRENSAHALGDFQITPAFAADYGVTDRLSFDQSATGAARGLRHYLDEFHGDLQEAVAAYNAGPGNVEGAIQQYGNAWLQHLPAETQNYVSKVLGGGGGGVRVVIENKTGHDINISTSSLPG